jgi:aldose 1-epimerase
MAGANLSNHLQSVQTADTGAGNCYTVQNKNGTAIVVADIGAAVVSLWAKDKNGILSDVVLGYETPAEYLHDEFYMGTVVGRYANRIAGGTVVIDGVPYKLSAQEGGYHLHGGFSGFNKKKFHVTAFCNNGSSGLVLKYSSPHLDEGFPGELHLTVIYTLDDNDNWTVEYRAVADTTTIINITQHTYFNLSGNPAETVDEHQLQINSGFYLPVNNLQVPDGELACVTSTPFDFTRFKKIAKDMMQDNEQLKLSKGYDHSFVLETEHSPELKHAAAVKDPVSGRRMDVFTTEPSVHFYTGNYLHNVKGKDGIIYNSRSGFCLETQHFPDAPNHPHFPSTVLKAGEQFYSKTVFKFSVDQ